MIYIEEPERIWVEPGDWLGYHAEHSNGSPSLLRGMFPWDPSTWCCGYTASSNFLTTYAVSLDESDLVVGNTYTIANSPVQKAASLQANIEPGNCNANRNHSKVYKEAERKLIFKK